ncbi:MAG: DUF7948 domain-containing protein [Chitinophagaceae bacterium]
MKKLGVLWVLLGMVHQGLSQGNPSHFAPLQFLRNQGQWNQRILYKTDIGADFVFLRRHGFSFTLFSPADLQKLPAFNHGHPTTPQPKYHPVLSLKEQSLLGMAHPESSTDGLNKGWVHGHNYSVNFLDTRPGIRITADHRIPTYYNFFIGSDSSKWKSSVPAFLGVNYQGLYHQIDLRVYSEASQLKYDLIIYPGGHPEQIRMQYSGTNGLVLKKNLLHIHTSVGTVVELSPYAYQIIGNQKKLIRCSYELKGTEVRFKVASNYDKNVPLIIDPSVIFATFTGSTADNWGFTATYDQQGNFYAGGIVFGQTGNYILTPGAFQQNFGGGSGGAANEGGYDMAIAKFDPFGKNLIYATYLGGSDNDQPHSLVVNKQGDLIIAGRSMSSNYPLQPATNAVGKQGGWDIVLTELNPTGTALIGSIRIGGSGADGVNMSDNRELGTDVLMRNYGDDARSEVELDGSGNIYLASCTQSDNFPVTSGVFQPKKGDAGLQDGVVLKLQPDLSGLIWASYLGGNGDDAAYVVELDKNNNLYVAGGTSSTNFPVTPGVMGPTYFGGACDGFITEITNDGSRILRSTYLGTNQADEVYGLQMDNQGAVYVTGTTEGSWPIVNALYSNPGSKQFISKLQPDLSGPFIYSTVFGTPEPTPNISPVAFLVDKCQNVYVSGWGGRINTIFGYTPASAGTTGMPITSDAFQTSTDGSDFYFFVLKRDATSQLFGTYYGGNGLLEHVDGGTSRFDPNGVIYEAICGGCGGSSNFPVTPGVWSIYNRSKNCNEIALKIAFNLSGVRSGLKSANGDTSGCLPLTLTLEDTVRNAKSYLWSFGDGTPDTTTVAPTYSLDHTFSALGTFRVRLIALDPSSCNLADTSYMLVRVRDDHATVAFTAQKIPPCSSLAYQFTNTSVGSAGKPFLNRQVFTWNFGDGGSSGAVDISTLSHSYSAPGDYPVTLVMSDTNYCNSVDSARQVIHLSPQVVAAFTTPSDGCAPYTALFTNTGQGGTSFHWDFGDPGSGPQDSSASYSATHQYQLPGTYVIRLMVQDSTSCNKVDSVMDTIRVHAVPVAGFSFGPVPPQENTAEVFTNQSMGAQEYMWNFGDGSGVDTTQDPSHIFPKTGTFTVCLRSANQYGCADSVCKPVSAFIVPGFAVPNAFSPNGDGINDVFLVKGFGISEFDLQIFNRWGQLVFESRDPNRGWDGRFRGVMQPMDVYGYALRIGFSDGTRATKSGSITLLR